MHMCECLRETSYVLRSYQRNTDRAIALPVVLSILILIEELRRTLLHECEFRYSIPHVESIQADYEVMLMQENGWCKSEICRLHTKLPPSGMYYASLLDRPRRERSHGGCTTHECNVDYIDPKKYKTRHVVDGCHCKSLSVSLERLHSILKKGLIPLVFYEESNLDDLDENIIESGPDVEYVAISHVWADGLGNADENSLPRCQLSFLTRIVKALYPASQAHMPFWIDTICCPTSPKEATDLAISFMRRTYKDAVDVLVIGTYLQAQKSSGLTDTELLMRIFCSPWQRRLWTYQEGALAQRLRFQFSDVAIDMQPIILRYATNEWSPPVANYLVTLYLDLRRFTEGLPVEDPPPMISQLSKALVFRSTSVSSDEALCLCTMLDLDIAKLLSISPEDRNGRMMELWKMMPNIPADVAFTTGPKLEDVGYRWAPSTFLGRGSQISGSGYPSARRTDSGLEFECYGFHLKVPPLQKPPFN